MQRRLPSATMWIPCYVTGHRLTNSIVCESDEPVCASAPCDVSGFISSLRDGRSLEALQPDPALQKQSTAAPQVAGNIHHLTGHVRSQASL